MPLSTVLEFFFIWLYFWGFFSFLLFYFSYFGGRWGLYFFAVFVPRLLPFSLLLFFCLSFYSICLCAFYFLFFFFTLENTEMTIDLAQFNNNWIHPTPVRVELKTIRDRQWLLFANIRWRPQESLPVDITNVLHSAKIYMNTNALNIKHKLDIFICVNVVNKSINCRDI